MRKYFVLLILLMSVSPTYSQSFFDTIISKEWAGTGTLMGSEANFVMKWDKVLDGQFYRLEFMNERNAENGKITFRAIGFYKVTGSTSLEGTWFDSRGISFPLEGIIADNQLVVNWGTPASEEGKSVYTIMQTGEISVEDYVQQDGKSVLFGKAVYH